MVPRDMTQLALEDMTPSAEHHTTYTVMPQSWGTSSGQTHRTDGKWGRQGEGSGQSCLGGWEMPGMAARQ